MGIASVVNFPDVDKRATAQEIATRLIDLGQAVSPGKPVRSLTSRRAYMPVWAIGAVDKEKSRSLHVLQAMRSRRQRPWQCVRKTLAPLGAGSARQLGRTTTAARCLPHQEGRHPSEADRSDSVRWHRGKSRSQRIRGHATLHHQFVVSVNVRLTFAGQKLSFTAGTLFDVAVRP